MDFLSRRINRTLTFKRNETFHYTIKKQSVVIESSPISKNPLIQPSKLILPQSPPPHNYSIKFPNIRRKIRYNTVEISKAANDSINKLSQKDLLTPKSDKKNIEIPIDFSSSIANLQVKNKPKSRVDSLSNEEKIPFSPPTEKKQNFEEHKEICEISSSQEFSFPEIAEKKAAEMEAERLKKAKRLKKKNSISFEINPEEISVSYVLSDRCSIQPKVPRKFSESSMDHTLETDKVNEMNSEESIPFDINSPMRTLNTSKTDAKFMDFDEALSKFYSLPVVKTKVSLWNKGFWEYIFCCLHKPELPNDSLDLCEKVIIFAYTGFSVENLFHLSLLFSVYNTLQIISEVKGQWTEVGFSSNNPYQDDLIHDMAALGLMMFMFLDKFFPITLEEIVKYSLNNEIAFLLLAFDMTELAIFILRKGLLNELIAKSHKTLEVLFFFYAGCLMYWYEVHKAKARSHWEITKIVEKVARKDPKLLINLAKQNLPDLVLIT